MQKKDGGTFYRVRIFREYRKSFPYHKKRGVDRELNVNNTIYIVYLSVGSFGFTKLQGVERLL